MLVFIYAGYICTILTVIKVSKNDISGIILPWKYISGDSHSYKKIIYIMLCLGEIKNNSYLLKISVCLVYGYSQTNLLLSVFKKVAYLPIEIIIYILLFLTEFH